MDRSYKVGDYIILDSGERGEVVDIGIRSTRIKTRDDVLITIPNSVMAVAKITIESAPVPSFRIRIPLGVAYGSDLDYVEKVLLDLIKANSLVASRPDPRVRYRAFADSTINLELLCWVKDPRDKGIVTHHIFKDIDRVFKEEGISIPFPQAEIYLHGTSDVMEKPL
jgi:small-conductance mechanosensitive channel